MTKDELKHLFDRYSGPIFFVAGFLFDVVTLDRLDSLTNFVFQVLYLFIGYFSYFLILTQKVQREDEVDSKILRFFYRHADDIHHFAIGSLLSAYALYFFKSASLSTSYIFLIIMFALLFLNELQDFKKLGPWIKSGLLKLCLTSFCCAYVPILIGKAGTISFLLALILSVFFSFCLGLYLAKFHIAWPIFKSAYLIPKIATISVFLLLYLFRVFPPVPLALKFAGIYHNIEKGPGTYTSYDQKSFWRFWENSDETFLARAGDKVFLFIRLFAPGGLEQKIYVVYQRKVNGEWKSSDKIPIRITGGREGGFRGMTYKENYVPGDWRVLIMTGNDLEVGRLGFQIIEDKSTNERDWNVKVH